VKNDSGGKSTTSQIATLMGLFSAKRQGFRSLVRSTTIHTTVITFLPKNNNELIIDPVLVIFIGPCFFRLVTGKVRISLYIVLI
jgi:hypothetical protein